MKNYAILAAAMFPGFCPPPKDDSPYLAEKYRTKEDPERGKRSEERKERRRIKRERNNLKSTENQYSGHASHQSGLGLSS